MRIVYLCAPRSKDIDSRNFCFKIALLYRTLYWLDICAVLRVCLFTYIHSLLPLFHSVCSCLCSQFWNHWMDCVRVCTTYENFSIFSIYFSSLNGFVCMRIECISFTWNSIFSALVLGFCVCVFPIHNSTCTEIYSLYRYTHHWHSAYFSEVCFWKRGLDLVCTPICIFYILTSYIYVFTWWIHNILNCFCFGATYHQYTQTRILAKSRLKYAYFLDTFPWLNSLALALSRAQTRVYIHTEHVFPFPVMRVAKC